MFGSQVTDPSYQYFLIGSTISLGSILLGMFGASILMHRNGDVPTGRVVAQEVPLLLYLWAMTFFMMVRPLEKHWVLGWAVFCLASGAAYLNRIFKYSVKREARHRIEMLSGLQQVSRELERSHLQIMSQVERAKYLNARQESHPRRSRYKRDPVI